MYTISPEASLLRLQTKLTYGDAKIVENGYEQAAIKQYRGLPISELSVYEFTVMFGTA